jgi:hypothetical protein
MLNSVALKKKVRAAIWEMGTQTVESFPDLAAYFKVLHSPKTGPQLMVEFGKKKEDQDEEEPIY